MVKKIKHKEHHVVPNKKNAKTKTKVSYKNKSRTHQRKYKKSDQINNRRSRR